MCDSFFPCQSENDLGYSHPNPSGYNERLTWLSLPAGQCEQFRQGQPLAPKQQPLHLRPLPPLIQLSKEIQRVSTSFANKKDILQYVRNERRYYCCRLGPTDSTPTFSIWLLYSRLSGWISVQTMFESSWNVALGKYDKPTWLHHDSVKWLLQIHATTGIGILARVNAAQSIILHIYLFDWKHQCLLPHGFL